MKYSGTYPSVTSIQTGNIVYFIEANVPCLDVVVKTESVNTGGGEVQYAIMRGGSKRQMSEVFLSQSELQNYFDTALGISAFSFAYNLDTIFYMYQSDENLIVVNGSGSHTVSYTDPYEARRAVRSLKELYWKAWAWINASNGNVYMVNVKQVQSYSTSTADLLINFGAGNVTFTCIDSTDATNNHTYLDFIYKNYDPEARAFSGKTKISVPADQPTLQKAINYIADNSLTSSHYFSVESGVINETNVILRNNVNGQIKDGVMWEIDGTGKFIYDNSSTVSCTIYGDCIYKRVKASAPLKTYNPFFGFSGDAVYNYAVELKGNGSNLKFAFKEFVDGGYDVRTLANLEGKIWIKGRWVYSGLTFLYADDDFSHIDLDVASANAREEVFNSSGSTPGYLYFRGGDYVGNSQSAGIINIDSSTQQPRKVRMIATSLKNLHEQGIGVMWFEFNQFNLDFRVWGNFWFNENIVASQDPPYILNTIIFNEEFPLTIIRYGKTRGNLDYDDFSVDVSGSGQYITDSSITKFSF